MGLPRRLWIAAVPSALAAFFGLKGANAQAHQELQDVIPSGKHEDVRLPNGKRQSDEILKIEFQKNMDDARQLAGLTRSLEDDLEKEDRWVLSLGTLKKLDDIEKITRRIRSRLKHA